jgi:hypothetical protein
VGEQRTILIPRDGDFYGRPERRGGDSRQGVRSPYVRVDPDNVHRTSEQAWQALTKLANDSIRFPLRQNRQVNPAFDEAFRDFAKIKFTAVKADVPEAMTISSTGVGSRATVWPRRPSQRLLVRPGCGLENDHHDRLRTSDWIRVMMSDGHL